LPADQGTERKKGIVVGDVFLRRVWQRVGVFARSSPFRHDDQEYHREHEPAESQTQPNAWARVKKPLVKLAREKVPHQAKRYRHEAR
jgi:hypothetical protein